MSEPQDDIGFASINADNLQLTDFGVDNNGVINTFQGVDLKSLQSKQLRAVASKLKIKGIRNAKKESVIEAIVAIVGAKKAYEVLDLMKDNKESPDKVRKTIHCSFCLMNILFSDKFCEEFAQLGNAASRATLDTGKAGNDCHFWEKIQVEYQVDNPLYGILEFTDVDVFEAQEDVIDPSKVLPHDWKKLRTIWKGIAADYKAALSRFTLSGTHESDFYNFCNGKIEPYYLRKLLEVKPDLVGFVEPDLPHETFLDTSGPILDGSSSNSNSEVNSSKRKRQKTSGSSEIAEAIRDATNSRMQSELSKQRLFLLQQEQQRRMEAEEVKKTYLKEKTKGKSESHILQNGRGCSRILRVYGSNLMKLARMKMQRVN